jgi:hypothetical protein
MRFAITRIYFDFVDRFAGVLRMPTVDDVICDTH